MPPNLLSNTENVGGEAGLTGLKKSEIDRTDVNPCGKNKSPITVSKLVSRGRKIPGFFGILSLTLRNSSTMVLLCEFVGCLQILTVFGIKLTERSENILHTLFLTIAFFVVKVAAGSAYKRSVASKRRMLSVLMIDFILYILDIM